MRTYKKLFRIKKNEVFLIGIILSYILLKEIFSKFLNQFLPILFIFEIYLTVSVYVGIRMNVFEEKFNFKSMFKEGLYLYFQFFTSILFIVLPSAIVYSFTNYLISLIPTYSNYSFIFFIFIIFWASFPFFHIAFTLFAPFFIIAEDVAIIESIIKSYKFMKGKLSELICLFTPILTLWFLFFSLFHKYDKIIQLKFILVILVSTLEILTVKLVFLIYKGVKDERNF